MKTQGHMRLRHIIKCCGDLKNANVNSMHM